MRTRFPLLTQKETIEDQTRNMLLSKQLHVKAENILKSNKVDNKIPENNSKTRTIKYKI